MKQKSILKVSGIKQDINLKYLIIKKRRLLINRIEIEIQSIKFHLIKIHTIENINNTINTTHHTKYSDIKAQIGLGACKPSLSLNAG